MPSNTSRAAKLRVVPNLQEKEALTDADSCDICYGTGVEIVPGKGARTCECRQRDSHSSFLDRAKLPRRYADCHFHNYKPQNPSQVTAFKFATSLTMEYPAVDQGLILMGTVGVGKTHLAVSILKGLTERGFTCLFYEFGSLLKEIQDSYNANTKASELGVLAPVLNAELLVLDELGGLNPTDCVRDTIAHTITSS
jgi:DNA replication protein DnaC